MAPYEVSRKLLHLAALTLPALMVLLGRQSLWILVPLATVAVASDIIRAYSAGFATFIRKTFGSLMRPSEFSGAPRQIIINGATWICCSAALMSALFPVDVAAAAVTLHMISDAVAAVIGRSLGRRRWPGTQRTLSGSAAYLVTGLVTMALWPAISLIPGALTAVAATAAEIPQGPLNDNLRVPLVAALTLTVVTG